jgi:hypothetical protein
MSAKPKIIKRETIEKQREEDRRVTLAYLKKLIRENPDDARRFLKEVQPNLSLTNALC